MEVPGSPVGYLFADIEGSVERWEKTPAQMQIAVARLDALIEELIARHGGVIQDRAGDGVFATFRSGNPLQCALEMQLSMQRQDWSTIGGLDLRIGVHAGEGDGSVVVDRAVANRGARIMSSGWGGQIVVSDDALAAFETPAGAELFDLGLNRFKGVQEPLRLTSLIHADLKRTEFPPLRSLLFAGGGPEAFAGPVFGRDRELSEILLGQAKARLLTLVGPGGNGKTRLALQASAEIASRHPVCFAALENASSDADAVESVASCLGLGLSAGRGTNEQVVDYLRDKRMLLVLDNAETIAGRASFVETWVARCPMLTVLVTSREPLGCTNEVLLKVDGLSWLGGAESPALQLFLHEARRKDPQFTVACDELPLFQEICALVEGSPLALRLTAKWTAVLSLEEILERLRQSITFLTTAGGGEARQSLRGVFDGVWRLMTPAPQPALARLSVFVKAFDLAAATCVAELDLETFSALERKGLLVRAPHGHFAMHVMVREFARERLEEDPAEVLATRDRHASYYLESLRDCMQGSTGPARAAAVEHLRVAFAEVRAAWFHAVAAGSDALLHGATEPLCYFLYTRSMMRDAVELFSAEPSDLAIRRHFGGILANFLVHQGDAEGASIAASKVLIASETSALARAHANHALGNLAHMRGDFDASDAHYQTGFELRKGVGDLRGCCYASISLGALHLLFSRVETAREHIKRGFRLARQIGDAFGMMASHVYAGDLAALEHRLDDAQENYEMSLRLEDAAPHPQFNSMLHRRLGTLFVLRGDPKGALAYHKKAHDVAQEGGDQRTRAHALIEIGNDLRLIGDLAEARQSLLRGIRLSMSLGMQPCLSRGLLELAKVEFAFDNIARARRLASVLGSGELGDLQGDYDALKVQLDGGEATAFAPITVQDLLNEIVEETELDTLKL